MDNELYERAFHEESLEGGYVPNGLFLFDTTPSTNDEIVKLADKGAPEGTLAIGAKQTMGQGRSGRSFFSPDGGNLYMSFLLRPSRYVKMELITPAAAVATVRGIKRVTGIDTEIKWVNDIYLGNKKISGMIAKAYNIEDKNRMYVVMGIGINVHMTDEAVPDDIPAYGTLLEHKITAGETDIIPRLAAAIYSEYMKIYTDIENPDFMDEYRQYSNVIGKNVTYLSGGEERKVKVLTIDDDGAIVVDDNGLETSYRDGEIRIQL